MNIKPISRWIAFLMYMLFGISDLKAQGHRCGTMLVLENAFKSNPSLRAKFEKQTLEIQQSVKTRISSATQTFRIYQDVVYIPIVFHIVLTNPAVVTDAQIHAQLNSLNKDFAGMNSDSVNIPAAFKPLFGKSHIQFTLAQRTPDDKPTTGIVRTTTTHVAYGTYDNSLKYSSLGGDDAWDHNNYLNVWVTNLGGGYVLGYATYPGASVPEEDGVVILYTTLPGGAFAPFNKGRTLTHETGHYFYLYHIWGDDNGCAGTDYVDDTPNQTTLTGGCPNGNVITDACTPTPPGVLYEDYMDYTDDACMSLFTNDQVTRMETTLNDYRAGYFTSNGAIPVNPNLIAKGFMVTPNPTTGIIAVQLYPNSATLKGIFIYNSSGQKVAAQLVNDAMTTYYPFNLGHFASGVYIVQAIFSDKTYTQKVIKQ